MSLVSLPSEILISIFPYLSAQDFISLTSTNRSFRNFHTEHQFWRTKVQSEFRIPSQPLFETDGARWQWLYKSLSTRSTVYTWGSDNHGNLARSVTETKLQKGWPRPMDNVQRIGTVVDVQCGGWSTVLMNSDGKLFAAGVIDGERLFQTGGRRGPEANIFPITMPMKPERQWLLDVSSRSVRQFSMGRKRLLALSDAGEVIEWVQAFTVAGEVLSMDHLRSDSDYAADPRASQIVAGWCHSSAFFPGYGLYYWSSATVQEELRGKINQIVSHTGDGDVRMVPGTKSSSNPPLEGSVEELMGNVKKYILLEHHIIILTDVGKLFSWRIPHTEMNSDSDLAQFDSYRPTELTTFYPTSNKFHILDIQGSFRKFGVFISDGSILIGSCADDDIPNTPRMQAVEEESAIDLPTPTVIPSLQNAGVIQLAFGDYHFQALHMTGEVTSHGHDPGCCGALGLGHGSIAFLRGVDWRPRGSGELLFHPKSNGRRTVWFEPEKFTFLCTMLDKFVTELSHDVTMKHAASRKPREFREVYGEWFEQESTDWHTGPEGGVHAAAEGGETADNPAYFPIKITAAGWSSAAVVLVDEERAEQIRQKYLLPRFRSASLQPLPQDSSNDNQGDSPASWSDWLKNIYHRVQTMTLGDASGYTDPKRCTEAECYVWSEQEFPRLKLTDGTNLAGAHGLAQWKIGEPSWLKN